jgi:hypothetical protein
MTFRIDASADANFNGAVDPAAGNPATLTLFFERKNDDFTNPKNRWWATSNVHIIDSALGSVVTISVPLEFKYWSDVDGQGDAADFADTLQNAGWFGLTFGGLNSCGHGVNMLAGTATFTLIDYQVE